MTHSTVLIPVSGLRLDHWTDGKRVVLWITSQPKEFGEIEDLDWGEQPPR